MQEEALNEYEAGWWSSGDRMHSIRHELGHAIQKTLSSEKTDEIELIRQTIVQSIGGTIDSEKIKFGNKEEKKRLQNVGEIISGYALANTGELIAESVAEYMTGNPRRIAKMVIQIIKR